MQPRRLSSRTFIALAAIAVAAFFLAKAVDYLLFSGYCDQLESQARDPLIQQALASWVSQNWTGESVASPDYREDDGIGPGLRWTAASIDPSILSMSERAHVRLLGPSSIDIRAGKIAENVRAIGFSERSRYVIIVQLPDRPRYIEGPWGLNWVTDSIGVVCER